MNTEWMGNNERVNERVARQGEGITRRPWLYRQEFSENSKKLVLYVCQRFHAVSVLPYLAIFKTRCFLLTYFQSLTFKSLGDDILRIKYLLC